MQRHRVVLDVEEVEWWYIKDTGSMRPVLDVGATVLTTAPSDEIALGDIILFQRGKETIIHRVIEKNEDENGVYYTAKGDNNIEPDPERIRNEDVLAVVVGIVY